ncbi:MAG: NTP transferase domain-containing protein [Chromatiales bacterium]
MSATRHAAILLAAGASRRLGTPKQLLTIDGEPLVRRAARAALATDPRQALAVLGAHAQGVLRGPDGHGAPGLPCATCHGEANPPASYGPHAPPGAPHWGLPSPDHKMAWIGLPPRELCEMIKDKKRNGDRNFDALITHVSTDKLVLWGWNPGGERAPVPVPHEEFVAQFKRWAAAGGPCPSVAARPE